MRKTALRLVSSTASHSSSFMRMARLSRVMPALFTRICSPPCSLTMLSISASTPAASLTSRTRPVQLAKADSDCDTLAAPASLVAVPMTFRPRSARDKAIAAPIPREAPVTKATWPSNLISLMLLRIQNKSLDFSQAGQIKQWHALHVGVDALGHACQHLARAALDQIG